MYICSYPSVSYIYTISISIPISTYLPTKPSSILILSTKKKQAPSITVSYSSPLLPVPRACAYVCVYIERMEGFSSRSSPVRTSPRPSAPLPPKKKKETFASAASPPLPCDGSSHIQSQLDKARQGKASYLPAKELRKK